MHEHELCGERRSELRHRLLHLQTELRDNLHKKLKLQTKSNYNNQNENLVNQAKSNN